MESAPFLPGVALLVSLALVPIVSSQSQTTQGVPRDAQAANIIQQTISKMGVVPADSTMTGTMTVTAGSSTETGSIEVLTRGVDQSRERTVTPTTTSDFVFSDGLASVSDGTTWKMSSLEWAQTAQSTVFPLPILARLLQDPDLAFAYVGQEIVNGTSAFHIQFWNTFASNPQLQGLASLQRKDLWISGVTGLPIRIAYTEQDGRGWYVPKREIQTTYESYQSINGVAYPLRIDRTLNRSPWQTITVNKVTFNSGLSDSNFPLE